MATAELAVAIPALLLVLAVALSAVRVGIDRVRCVDAAAAGARLLARGEPAATVRNRVAALAPSGAEVTLEVREEQVLVRVRGSAPEPLAVLGAPLTPQGEAVARREGSP
ncbi:hypothetical protein GCM10012283_26010 [Phycicoccus endophyticus]|nr:hypothetical protein GCM10012283_26010 [Phycicoccus endophyticus]